MAPPSSYPGALYDHVGLDDSTIEGIQKQRDALMSSIGDNRDALTNSDVGGLSPGQGLASALIALLPTLIAGGLGGKRAGAAAAPAALAGADQFNKATESDNKDEFNKQLVISKLNQQLGTHLDNNLVSLIGRKLSSDTAQRDTNVSAAASATNNQNTTNASNTRAADELALQNKEKFYTDDADAQASRNIAREALRQQNAASEKAGLGPKQTDVTDEVIDDRIKAGGPRTGFSDVMKMISDGKAAAQEELKAQSINAKDNKNAGGTGEYQSFDAVAPDATKKQLIPNDAQKKEFSQAQQDHEAALKPLEDMQSILANRKKDGQGQLVVTGEDAQQLQQDATLLMVHLRNKGNFDMGVRWMESEKTLMNAAMGPNASPTDIAAGAHLITQKLLGAGDPTTALGNLKANLDDDFVNKSLNNNHLPVPVGKAADLSAKNQLKTVTALKVKGLQGDDLVKAAKQIGISPDIAGLVNTGNQDKLLNATIKSSNGPVPFKNLPVDIQRKQLEIWLNDGTVANWRQ